MRLEESLVTGVGPNGVLGVRGRDKHERRAYRPGDDAFGGFPQVERRERDTQEPTPWWDRLLLCRRHPDRGQDIVACHYTHRSNQAGT
jgi:hypothetical protein